MIALDGQLAGGGAGVDVGVAVAGGGDVAVESAGGGGIAVAGGRGVAVAAGGDVAVAAGGGVAVAAALDESASSPTPNWLRICNPCEASEVVAAAVGVGLTAVGSTDVGDAAYCGAGASITSTGSDR